MRVLFITAEAAPFIKVGGLGDVAGTLPHELVKAGVDVRMALPLHHQIDRRAYDLKHLLDFSVPSSLGEIRTTVYETIIGKLPVYLFDSPLLPKSGPLYSTDSAVDGPKFIHFSIAALEFVKHVDWQPDVVHAQDWHTAASLYALDLQRELEPRFENVATLLTVHNLPYHGEGAAQALTDFGLPPATRSRLPWWAQHRPLALGLLAADHINTVSPGYAAEMLTEEFGAGLHDFLREAKKNALSGILNGLDLEAWNPETDKAIAAQYTRSSLVEKKKNRSALQRELGLPEEAKALIFGIVSRMDEQKGIDIALDALRMVKDENWQAVILGTGNADIEESAHRLGVELPDKVRVRIDFNSALGRRIYAGVDAFLIPSRYEPCGLTQMISMRYGTVPIARSVGGLKDTIDDFDSAGGGTGFLFHEPAPAVMAAALRRALHAFGDQRRWRGLQMRGMRQDFSWDFSARKYLALYERLSRNRMR